MEFAEYGGQRDKDNVETMVAREKAHDFRWLNGVIFFRPTLGKR